MLRYKLLIFLLLMCFISCGIGIYWFMRIRVYAEPEYFSADITGYMYNKCKGHKVCKYGDKFLFTDGTEYYYDINYWVKVEGNIVTIETYSYSPATNTPIAQGFFSLRNLPGKIDDYKFKYTYTHENYYEEGVLEYLEGDVFEIK
jgi:hypothetical protein